MDTLTFEEFEEEFNRIQGIVNKQYADENAKSESSGYPIFHTESGQVYDDYKVLLKDPNFIKFHHKLFPNSQSECESNYHANCYDTIYD